MSRATLAFQPCGAAATGRLELAKGCVQRSFCPWFQGCEDVDRVVVARPRLTMSQVRSRSCDRSLALDVTLGLGS
jgi:hypothetical protein